MKTDIYYRMEVVFVKKVSILASILLICFMLCSCASVKNTVATVDKEIIGRDEVLFMMAQSVDAVNKQMSNMTDTEKEEYWNTDVNGKKPIDIIRENATSNLIDYTVLANYAESEKISVSKSEVNARMKSLYTAEKLEEFRETYGVFEGAIKKVIRKQLLQQKYVAQVLENKINLEPADEELSEIFHSKYYKAKHILISTVDMNTNAPLSEEEKEKAYADAQRLSAKIENGEKFDELMLDYSDDPKKVEYPNGYVFTEGQMIPEFYNTVVNLPENGVSDVVESSYGYHIIKREPLNDGDITEFSEQLKLDFKNGYIKKHIEELKSKCDIKQDDAKLNEITVNTGF